MVVAVFSVQCISCKKEKEVESGTSIDVEDSGSFFFTTMQVSETVMWMSMVVTLFMVAVFVQRVQR